MKTRLIALVVLFLGLAIAAADTTPPTHGYASDAWLETTTTWADERQRREAQIAEYFSDQDPARAQKYGFRSGHHPALAWNWFDQHPVGFNGIPYVLLQTLLSLDPATETDPHLLKLAKIWRKPSTVADEGGLFTLDHLGAGPHWSEYEDGVAKRPEDRTHLLPNGFVYDPRVTPDDVWFVDWRLRLKRRFETLALARSKIRQKIYDEDVDYQNEPHKLQKAPKVDAVFLSCSGCHLGRVVVDGEIDSAGELVKQGKIKFLPGTPNTEIEAQHYSELLLETGLALIESGFSIDATALPDPDKIKPRRDAVEALYSRMVDRALDDELIKTIYGPDPESVKRAQLQTYWVAVDFATYLGNLIGTAVKTQYTYYQVANKYGFNPDNPNKSPGQQAPTLMHNRPGQMDAFGIASGLVAIHSQRPDGSYIKFLESDYPGNPLFTGINAEGLDAFRGPAGPEAARDRILSNIASWAPPVPAPIDIKSLNWAAHRELANWDGNQGAAARALASGTSATGDPRQTNVEIHEPLNPFIDNLPPPPYPFEVDKEKARRGKAVFEQAQCADCHKPNNDEIFPISKLGVDSNRSRVNTDVSRYGLAGLVMEACRIFIRNNPGNDWCLPRDKKGQVINETAQAYDNYFKDTPGRVRDGRNGYKADMLHGIWARAPYLHNGSVPTLLQLMCPGTRPAKFKRGVLYYDQAMVGFEWEVAPRQRYGPHDTILVKDYDTTEFGRGNGGHDFADKLCPDTSDLDPVRDRHEIANRVLSTDISDLLEYLKTL